MSPPFRIPVTVFEPIPISVGDNGFGSLGRSTIHARRTAGSSGRKGNPHTVAIVVGIVGGIIGFWAAAFLLRYLYRKCFLSYPTYQPAHHEEDSPTTRQINRENQADLEQSLAEVQVGNGSYDPGPQQDPAAGTLGIDRNTSVRSVMTLPAYRPKPAETELVLGREGERDGIDVVVEMTTAEQEEALRDEEMESMYQIRAARRRQQAEREERRRLRREAREANDLVALQELREQARLTSAQHTSEIEALRQEHERIRETRQRAVSSVSYADVGIARADGTRIRANSTESTERVGLLSDAASIAASTTTTAGGGDTNSLFYSRTRSASATLSIDSARAPHHRPASPNPSTYSLAVGNAGRYTPQPTTHSRSPSVGATATATPRAQSPSPSPLAGSSPELIDAPPGHADLGEGTMGPGLGLGLGMDMSMSMMSSLPPPPDYDEVSLDDGTHPPPSRAATPSPLHSRSGSPYPDPPPEYPGGPPRAGVGAGGDGDGRERGRRRSNGGGGGGGGEGGRDGSRSVIGAEDGGESARSPSLTLGQVPQIVIEPSSGRP